MLSETNALFSTHTLWHINFNISAWASFLLAFNIWIMQLTGTIIAFLVGNWLPTSGKPSCRYLVIPCMCAASPQTNSQTDKIIVGSAHWSHYISSRWLKKGFNWLWVTCNMQNSKFFKIHVSIHVFNLFVKLQFVHMYISYVCVM